MLAVAAVCLSLGMVLGINPRHPATMVVFTLALLAMLVAVFAPTFSWLGRARPRQAAGVLLAGLCAQLVLMTQVPAAYFMDQSSPMTGPAYPLGIALVGALVAAVLIRRAWDPRGPLFLAILAVFLAMGASVIVSSPDPPIDVHIFQKQGVETLLRGENPYSIRTYPDIYGQDSSLYAPGLVEDGRLTFGFPYPPLSLLVATPAEALLGDYRYAQLVSLVVASFLAASLGRSAISILSALLLLFSARSLYILEQGWTEPSALALLALTAWLALQRSALLPAAVGLAAVIKQHLVPLLPLAIIALSDESLRGGRWRLALVATAVGAIVTLPLILWNPGDFIHSTVLLHLRQPFRPDSLSYMAWLSDGVTPWIPAWAAFVVVVPLAIAAVRSTGRSAAAFVTTTAVVYLVFFLLNKQAFVHYYHFVLGAICVAMAAWVATAHEEQALTRSEA